MKTLENFFAVDFDGSEYTMVKYLTNIGLNCMKYQYQMKCLGCSQEISKIVNLTTFDKFAKYLPSKVRLPLSYVNMQASK